MPDQHPGADDRFADAEPAGGRSGQDGADEGAHAAGGEDEADLGGAEAEIVGHVEHVDGQESPAEEGGGGAATGEGAQERVGNHGPEPFGDGRDHLGSMDGAIDRRLLRLDLADQDRGEHKRDGVDRNRGRRGDERDQAAAEAGAGNLGEGGAGLQLPVALEQVVAADKRR